MPMPMPMRMRIRIGMGGMGHPRARTRAVPEAIDPAVLDAFQTDCGMPFLYALCTMAFRVNIQKLFGTGPPQTNNAFALATGEEMQIH